MYQTHFTGSLSPHACRLAYGSLARLTTALLLTLFTLTGCRQIATAPVESPKFNDATLLRTGGIAGGQQTIRLTGRSISFDDGRGDRRAGNVPDETYLELQQALADVAKLGRDFPAPPHVRDAFDYHLTYGQVSIRWSDANRSAPVLLFDTVRLMQAAVVETATPVGTSASAHRTDTQTLFMQGAGRE